MSDTAYILVQDDDTHWYVIPADKQGEWEAWNAAATKFWDGDMEGGAPQLPEWAVEVGGGPCLVKFRVWWIE